MKLDPALVLGDIAIQLIHETTIPYFYPLKFFPGLTQELLDENLHWLAPHAYDRSTGKMILSSHSYLVTTRHHRILIDTCVGNHKERPMREHNMQSSDDYIRNLKALGLSVNDIDFVLCSHLHYDHVGWNTRLENGRWIPTFPNARYVFARREYEHWSERHARQPIAAMTDSILPILEAGRAELVSNDHMVCDHVQLQPTPGHTVDHCAIRVANASGEALFTGDLTHTPLQLRYPELSARADFDQTLASQTRRQFFERSIANNAHVCTMHYPTPSYGQLERWGDGFRFMAR